MADKIESKVTDTTNGDHDLDASDQPRDPAAQESKSNSSSEAEADDDKPQTKTGSSTDAGSPDIDSETADDDSPNDEPSTADGSAAKRDRSTDAADDSTPEADSSAEASDFTTDDDSETADDSADNVDESSAVAADSAGDAAGEPASTKELAVQLTELRAEYEVLQHQLEAQTKPKPKRVRRPSRAWVSIACVVLGGLLLPLAVLVRWTSSTLLDTDVYVETVAPLAENEDIQEALSFRISAILLDVIDFTDLAKDALPTRAGFLAAPIESGVAIIVEDIVEEFVSTQAFERLWEDINRLGHDDVVAVLTGNGNDTLDVENGKVVLRLGPMAKEVINSLDGILGTDLQNSIPDERLDGEFVLVDSQDLADLQGGISLFDRLSWLIPILTIALLAASVIISRPRRLAFRRLGIAIVAPMAISLLLYDWVRSQYISALPDETHNPDAAAAVYDITTRFVPRDMAVLLVFGLVILFLAWLFGPTGWAGRARAWWDTLVGTVGDKSEGRDVGPVPSWVVDNERKLLTFTFALGVLTLLVWTRPTGWVVLIVIVVVALVMAATSLLAEIGRRAEAEDAADAADAAVGVESPGSGELVASPTGSPSETAESG